MLIIQRPEIEAVEAEGKSQSFMISPLEPGFGHTLGNSLRRTLLSSIPGAAVTQVRFDDALHEFDVISGVKEDVTDVILNLKDLVLRCSSDEAVTLRLDRRGPAEVRAGDIQTTADVEVLNPDLYIANVNASGRIALDLTVARPRASVRGARPVRATAQLPQARAHRLDRSARTEVRGRPARDHELRCEVARRSDSKVGRAGLVVAGEGVAERCRLPRRA